MRAMFTKNFKEYNSIPNFLMRKTVLHIGKLHIRLHDILSEDKTPFLHTHPFHYISIILKGGYTEEIMDGSNVRIKKHKVGSILVRSADAFHRIKSLEGPTKTFFITWKVKRKWRLMKHQDIPFVDYIFPKEKGVYVRNIKGVDRFSKFDEFWYIGNDTPEGAMNENRLSIHQDTRFDFMKLYPNKIKEYDISPVGVGKSDIMEKMMDYIKESRKQYKQSEE